MCGSLRGVPVQLVLVVLGLAFLSSEFTCIDMRRGCSGGALCALWFDFLLLSRFLPVSFVRLL